ncbi:hypothetical protein llap_14183 [Limosa lapponica baueri]|uniref:Uncharacterized protein n=1 Tax=Limosa lapponica baueri TaxID=1758121 RepID=A0A2I0TP27_LIMLA|nr:hypothetical protein llap_14183 [Limosa lapponica baueri]
MYERHKRRYSLCDISKVDRTVDVVLLKRCECDERGYWAQWFATLQGSLGDAEVAEKLAIIFPAGIASRQMREKDVG